MPFIQAEFDLVNDENILPEDAYIEAAIEEALGPPAPAAAAPDPGQPHLGDDGYWGMLLQDDDDARMRQQYQQHIQQLREREARVRDGGQWVHGGGRGGGAAQRIQWDIRPYAQWEPARTRLDTLLDSLRVKE